MDEDRSVSCWRWSLWLMAAVVVGSVPVDGWAQSNDRPPVVVSVVHAGEGAKGRNYRTLTSLLKNSESIDYRKPGRVVRALSTRGVQPGTLTDAGKRTAKRDEVGDAMREVGLELLFVFWEGDQQMHFVTIGPTGRELRHHRLEGGQQLTNAEAKKLFKKVFEVGMPEVFDFREDPQEQRQEASATESTSSDSSGGESSGEESAGGGEPSTPEALRQRAISKHRSRHGNMYRHLQVDLQPVGGVRGLTVNSPDGFTQNQPLVGGRLDVETIFSMVDSDTVGLALTGQIDFAPFQETFQGVSGSLPGTYFRGQATFRYMKGLSKSLVIFGEAGGNVTDVGIASNEVYVGSRYVSALGGFGVLIRPTQKIDVEIVGRVLPILSGDTNDKKFGSPTPGIGANGRAKLSLRMFRPWRLTAFYDLSYMSLNYSEPPNLDSSVGTSDLFHVAGIGVGYRLGFGDGSN